MGRRGRFIKRGAAAALTSFAGAALGACSLFVSTDGLTSNGALDAEADATAEAADTSSDVAVLEASNETGTDAAPVPFCATSPTTLFCDDFDFGAVGASWDSKQDGDGSISLDSSQFRSAPFSATFLANGASSVVQLERSVAVGSGSYRFELSLRIAAAPVGNSAYRILARFDNGNGAQLELFEDSGSFSVNDRINGAYGTFYSGLSIPIGAWVDLVLHVKFAAAGGASSASIDIDGSNVVSTFAIASAFNQPSNLGLAVGLPFCSGSSGAVSIDNVKISSE